MENENWFDGYRVNVAAACKTITTIFAYFKNEVESIVFDGIR